MVRLYLSPGEASLLEDLAAEIEGEVRGLDELTPDQERLVRHLLKDAVMWMED